MKIHITNIVVIWFWLAGVPNKVNAFKKEMGNVMGEVVLSTVFIKYCRRAARTDQIFLFCKFPILSLIMSKPLISLASLPV
jgi:hypothetical protein